MPISRITRNSLVYANNKTQNIESRLFGFGLPTQSGSLYLQNSQSLYLQDLSGTYVLEYPSAIALSYNSFYNKFIADRSTQNSLLTTRYYTSESKATGDFGYILYQNSRSVYTQATPDIYLLEYSATSSLLTDTGSNDLSLRTRYFVSESKATGDFGYILYQNSRSMYAQSVPDIYLLEYNATSSLLTDSGSNDLSLRTRYYTSESKGSGNFGYILYQNNRSMYAQSVPDIYLLEYSSTSSLLTDTGSNALLLTTRYYTSESKGSGNFGYILYQNSRSVYLQDPNSILLLYDPDIVPVGTSASLQETSSNVLSFRTKYYLSESIASSTFLGYQNDRAIYLENISNPFVIEYSGTSSLLTDTGSNNQTLLTKYYTSESIASSVFLGYQNDRAVYLENTDNPFVIEYSSTSSLLTDSGSNNQLLLTKYYLSESIASGSLYIGYQNDRSIYLENLTDVFVLEP